MDHAKLVDLVTGQVNACLLSCEPFTSACISHPIIEQNSEVRHRQVSEIVKDLWASDGFVGDDDGMAVDYLRTLIDVYPDGPGTKTKAYIYYPDNGYDPHSFTSNDRILTRNTSSNVPNFDMDADIDDGTTVINLANGSVVSKQCSVQNRSDALNVPRFVIGAAGWSPGDKIAIDIDADGVNIRRDDDGQQEVDKEGRVRLYGKSVAALSGTPTINRGTMFQALLVTPNVGDKYIQLRQ